MTTYMQWVFAWDVKDIIEWRLIGADVGEGYGGDEGDGQEGQEERNEPHD